MVTNMLVTKDLILMNFVKNCDAIYRNIFTWKRFSISKAVHNSYHLFTNLVHVVKFIKFLLSTLSVDKQ